jgi:succinyl-diaminopimelate desuccinylase
VGGDALNKVPDRCGIDVDIRYLPGQDAKAILRQIEAIPDTEVSIIFHRDPAVVSRRNPYVRMLAESVEEGSSVDRVSVGRDGASDAVSFLDAGVPAVEFGPAGGGHHGPEEWVSIDSLVRYRKALVDFVQAIGDSVAPEQGGLRVA